MSTTAQAQSDSALADKDAWSTAAEGYKSSFAQYPLHSARAGLEAAKVQPGEKLLDVACGPGDLAVWAARDKGATVDCIDFSEGMIDAVKEKLEKEPVAVTTHVMDGQNLTFEDSTFDIVTSSFGVMLFPDWQKGTYSLACLFMCFFLMLLVTVAVMFLYCLCVRFLSRLLGSKVDY